MRVSHAYAVLDKGTSPYPGTATDMHVPGEPGARTDMHAISEPAVVLDNGCGVNYCVGADFRSRLDDRSRCYIGSRAQRDTVCNNRVRVHQDRELEPQRKQFRIPLQTCRVVPEA